MQYLTILPLALYTAGSTARGFRASAAKSNSADAAALRTVEQQFIRAFRDKDIDAIMQLCVPDDSLVVFDVHPPREYRGAQAYRKDWEELFSRFSGSLQAEVSEMEVTAGSDVGYVHSIHRVVGTMQDGNKVDYTVRVTDGFRKVNGKWLIAHTHVSFPVDPSTGKADLHSKP